MDDKALAKSKRAHSQQHSKKHNPKQKSKAPSGGTTENDAQSAKKPLGKQVTEKPSQSRGRASALPPNWDRYEEENDSGSEDPSASSANQIPDVVFPKSKGADYSHLITEAQSHSQSHLDLDTFPSVDDLLPGYFGQAVGSLLSVKAEGILPWIGDDNFVVDDKRTAHREATHDDEAVSGLSEESSFVDISEKVRLTDQTTEVTTSSTIVNDLPDPSLSIKESISENDHQSKAQDSMAQPSANSIKDANKKQSEFEAAATAEAELDMLLDSFSETKILDSTSFEPAAALPLQEEAKVSPFQLPSEGPDSLPSATGNLDDDLDDLLNKTSGLTNQSSSFQPQGERIIPFTQSSSNSGSKSKVLDDFDSWLETL
ncbi:hypothetical protein FNV43_RR13749 [Rhamnella rubrinervis]|uniref:Uncharacterized protein n=1 Tax=Rhamnella rubrinervis TaxID=2594499 RepID=A0A8K0H1Q5_9ROSA|nr:hypothetical protein FNV43_RR13749 [Rhamnella rubrinervis]